MSDVSTDGLVERLARIIQTADTLWLGSELDTIAEAKRRIEALQRSNAEMREALRECADDLEAEVKARWCIEPDGSCHPALQPKLERDLAPVLKARKALGDKTDA